MLVRIVWSAFTRLPAATLRSEIRPEMGAVTLVKSRFSRADRSAAVAAARSAVA